VATPVIVAIDGAAGSGKSTLARSLATELGVPYLNTGVMYRALARSALDRGIDPTDAEAVTAVLESLRFTLSSGDPPRELWVEGRRPGSELWAPDVEAAVSTVAAHPAVRARMVELQRTLGNGGGVVEGRDIGSVVFPHATAKIFLEAARSTRTERRAAERNAAGAHDLARVGEALRSRDARDARTNPHAPSAGAAIIDTTDLEVDDVLRAARELVRRAIDAE
jgi:CMP/dCMP kinase